MKTIGELLLNGMVATYFPDQIVMLILCYIITALAAYALGSLNWAVIISHVKYHDDIRKHGSGNAGMTNMLRTYGKADAALTFLGDALKTALAILFGMLLVGAVHGGNYVGGCFAILGHVFPCYYGFKGGKGVVASAVTILMLDPLVFAIIIAVFVVVVAISRYISLGSVICAMLYPLLVYMHSSPATRPVATSVALLIGLFVIFLHRSNIERLMTGKENKLSLSFGKKKNESKTYTVKKESSDKTNKKKH